MDAKKIVSRYLVSNPDIVEIQIEYKDGSTADFDLNSEETGVAKVSAITSLLSTVAWYNVEEVEVEFENGEKDEIDLDQDEDEETT